MLLGMRLVSRDRQGQTVTDSHVILCSAGQSRLELHRCQGPWLLLSVIPEVGLSPLHGLPKVCLVHDVVAVKDGPRFVAANRHGNPLRDPSPHHVPNSRPAEIVEDSPGVSGLTFADFAGMSAN